MMVAAVDYSWVHDCDFGDRTPIRTAPAELLEDLRAIGGFAYQEPRQISVDGRSAIVARRTPTEGSAACSADLHIDPITKGLGNSFISMEPAADSVLVDVGGGRTFLIDVWAHTEEDLEAWLPTAMDFVQLDPVHVTALRSPNHELSRHRASGPGPRDHHAGRLQRGHCHTVSAGLTHHHPSRPRRRRRRRRLRAPQPNLNQPLARYRQMGPWQVELTADELVTAGWPDDVTAPGTYTWTFGDGRARIDLRGAGNSFYCGAEISPWTAGLIKYDGGNCGGEVDDMDGPWTTRVFIGPHRHQRSCGPAKGVSRDKAWQPAEPVISEVSPGVVDIGGRAVHGVPRIRHSDRRLPGRHQVRVVR